MPNPKNPNQGFGYLIQVVVILCTWVGFRLWVLFSSPIPPNSPTSSGTSVFLEENDEPHENALREGVKENNQIEYQECKSIDSRIAEIDDLIARSDEVSHLIEARFDVMRSFGVGQPEIENHPDYEALEREHQFRETATAEIDRLLLILSINILKSD